MPSTAQYTPGDLAIVVPTYNRPDKIVALLESLTIQNCRPGRVTVVGSGQSVESEIMAFSDILDVEYLHCEQGGQIRQRNLGLDHIGADYPLVGCLDDDMVLEPGALSAILQCWNTIEPNAAGIGFNVVNDDPPPFSIPKALFFMSSHKQGVVLPSGYPTSLAHVQATQRTQWLAGGATVWRKTIIDQHRHSPLKARWAVGEDVRFSYPISKLFPLLVCANARIRHEHVYDYGTPSETHRYRGRKWVVAHLVFSAQHEELSQTKCLWMIMGSTLMSLYAACCGYKDAWNQAVGKMAGLWEYAQMRMKGLEAHAMLEDRE